VSWCHDSHPSYISDGPLVESFFSSFSGYGGFFDAFE
jgi:hypothetical protein